MSNRRRHRRSQLEIWDQQTLFLESKFINPGKLRVLSTAVLTSGLPYQRHVEPEDVDDLIRKWDPTLLTPLVVSYRDREFRVVDGQHRIAAIRKMAGNHDVAVLCLVYYDLTYEKEAALYYKLDQAKGQLRSGHAIKALLESCTNPEIIDVYRRIEAAGFVWALGGPTNEEYEIVATRALINAYRLLGGETFSRLLLLIAETWHGSPHSLKASVFTGMALFLKTYERELDDHAFIRSLSTIPPDEIIRLSKTEFTLPMRIARIIRDGYNSQQPEHRRLEYRFKK